MQLKRNEIDLLFQLIITSDENDRGPNCDEPAQSTSKGELHQKQIVLLISWDYKGAVYFELLKEPNDQF